MKEENDLCDFVACYSSSVDLKPLFVMLLCTISCKLLHNTHEVHPMKYASGLCFVVVCCGLVGVDFTHILQGCFTGTGAILHNPDEYGWIYPRADSRFASSQ